MPKPEPASADRAEAPLTLGERLALHRRRVGHSQHNAAQATGLSRNLISLIERGDGNPTAETLRRLHRYMDEAEPILTPPEQSMVDLILAATRAGLEVSISVRRPMTADPTPYAVPCPANDME